MEENYKKKTFTESLKDFFKKHWGDVLYIIILAGATVFIYKKIYPKYISYQKKDVKVYFNEDIVKNLGNLATIKIKLSDFYQMQKVVKKSNVLGFGSANIRGFLRIKGEGYIGVDLRKIEVKNVDKKNKIAELILPATEIFFISLNHKISADSEELVWNNATPQERSDFVANARATVKKNMRIELEKNKILMNQAQERAKILVKNFYKKLGWKIRFVSHREFGGMRL